ncbi:hypothetical protein A1359_17975 [Methylomonas lenta]|uniref:Uncharacterized protein n=1 Tax=Methylomonas lenta TaxID=980561 RepID=A0A177MYB0_9GAMM|nr:hypothetical protein [Methylomonas lenta]OAI09960.1 hypothetical protein A1359_17975 [Methylomonas lenta]
MTKLELMGVLVSKQSTLLQVDVELAVKNIIDVLITPKELKFADLVVFQNDHSLPLSFAAKMVESRLAKGCPGLAYRL